MPENMISEIVRLGSNAPVDQKPLTPVWEGGQAEEARNPYEEMTSYQLYGLLLAGKLPVEAVPIYFQTRKQEDLDRATGALYKRVGFSHPDKDVQRKFEKIAAAQHARILAEDYSDPQQIAREVAAIEARYDPLINGTPQDHARYFARRASELTSHQWQKPEDSTRASVWAANLYGMASQLVRPRGEVPQEPGRAAKLAAVRSALQAEAKTAA